MKNLNSKFICLFLLFLFQGEYHSCIYEQTQVREAWVQFYSGPGSWDVAESLTIDDEGNPVITGFSEASLSGEPDYVTIKYSSNGSEVWNRRYDGPISDSDVAYDICVDNIGNVYVTGSSWDTTLTNDMTTIKYNSSGMQQWVARHKASNNGSSQGFAIAAEDSGNVYVTGRTITVSGGNDYVTIKYKTNGNEQWIATYNGTGNSTDYATYICVDDSGNVYITGESWGNGTEWDYVTIKYNSAGIEQWVARYNGTGNGTDRVQGLAIDDSCNVYITGLSQGSGLNPSDYLTIKYSLHGIEKWVARYSASSGPSSDDYATDIAVDKYGNVFVTGYSYDLNHAVSGGGYTTIKYDKNGSPLWIARYSAGIAGDAAKALAIDDSGNVYVTGESSGPQTVVDIATVKYNLSGEEQWVIRYEGGMDDIVNDIALDDSANIIITGYSKFLKSNLSTGAKMITIKYEQKAPVSIRSTDNPNLFEGFFIQNFPNPFNETTTFRYHLPQSGLVVLKIFDILGHEIETLVEERQKAGEHVILWEAYNISSGIYFYQLRMEKKITTKKMLIFK